MGPWKPLIEFHWRGDKLVAKVERDLCGDGCVVSNNDVTVGERETLLYHDARKMIDCTDITVGMWGTDRGEVTGVIVSCFGFLLRVNGELVPHFRFIEPGRHNHRPSAMPHKFKWIMRDGDRIIKEMECPTLVMAKLDFEREMSIRQMSLGQPKS